MLKFNSQDKSTKSPVLDKYILNISWYHDEKSEKQIILLKSKFGNLYRTFAIILLLVSIFE